MNLRLFAAAFLMLCAAPGAQLSLLYIASEAMLPTLQVGDYVQVQPPKGPYQRGDLVVFMPPSAVPGDGAVQVKRIVALGGDTVEVRGVQVWLNGKATVEPYLQKSGAPGPSAKAVKVPKGQFFLMGDNRNNSFDSRYWGCLPLSRLQGKVTAITWSKDPSRIGPLGGKQQESRPQLPKR
jgi:signal peptidase I